MGSGDPSGLQNRRELALLALVSSTLTRFRQKDNGTARNHRQVGKAAYKEHHM